MTTSTANETTRATGAAYDETPYVGIAFPETHPDKLCAMARLFGLEAPDPARARVLELGCGDGMNLLPMAQHAPDARFLGIDASSRHVASGQAAIAACRLANAELRQQDVLEFGASEGKFDYIIAHGIFSWVPEQVRAQLSTVYSIDDDRNNVMVMEQFGSIERAKAFAGSPELKAAMGKAGVVGKPDIHFVKAVATSQP